MIKHETAQDKTYRERKRVRLENPSAGRVTKLLSDRYL